MDGFLNILKPPGMSSHDVVAFVRKLSRAKTGHTGTLDPAAAGVLVLALGKGTRLASFITDSTKVYRSELKLGQATTTGDAEGDPAGSGPVPPLDSEKVQAVFKSFTGPVKQKPPMHSALHHQGTRLYKLARRGLDVERPAREITIHELELVDIKKESQTLLFDVTCSKGTYVRVLCEDLARSLGTVGHMSFLVRRGSGPFTLEGTCTLEDLERDGGKTLEEKLYPLDYPLQELPALPLTAGEGKRISHGNPVILTETGGAYREGPVRIYCQERFIALGRVVKEKGQLQVKPGKVLL